MNAFSRLDNRPVWRKLLVIAAFMVPVMLWVLFTSSGFVPPFVPPPVLSLLFLPVAAYGFGVCALGGYWLGGRARWLLVPLLAMGVELAFAIPLTLADPGGETPVSVVLEAPFWTGAPALLGATLGAAARWFQEREAAARGAGQSQRHV